MKEVEERDDILEEAHQEEEIIAPSTPDDELFESLKTSYERATTIEAKFNYFNQMKLLLDARDMMGQTIPDNVYDTMDEIQDKFTRDLCNASTKDVASFAHKLNYSLREQSAQYHADKVHISQHIPSDDTQYANKVNYVAPISTVGALKIKTNAAYTNAIMGDLRTNTPFAQKLVTEKGITHNMTAKAFAEKCGYKGKRLEEYLSKRLKAKPDEPMKDVMKRLQKAAIYKMKVEDGSIQIPEADREKAAKDPYGYDKAAVEAIELANNEITYAIINEFRNQWLDCNLEAGRQKYYKDFKFKDADIKAFENAINEARSESNTGKIKDWVAEGGQGKALVNNLRVINARGLINDIKRDASKRQKGFDQYIRMHSGYEASHQRKSVAIDSFAKAIAANLLKENKENKNKFDVDMIHKVARNIKRMPEFKAIANDPNRLMAGMMDAQAVKNTQKTIIEKTFGISKDNIESYVTKMRTLYDNMSVKGSMSQEYKNLRKSIMKIANIGQTLNLRTAEGRKAASEVLVSLNANLLADSEKYMRGKKSVRGTNEGEFRFNNTIDALAIMSRYATGSKNIVQVSVDKINKVRKVDENHANYVKLENFGEERAKAAKEAREPKKNMVLELKNPKMNM